jgi:hypothetical protein
MIMKTSKQFFITSVTSLIILVICTIIEIIKKDIGLMKVVGPIMLTLTLISGVIFLFKDDE